MLGVALAGPATASAAPAPCGGAVQVSDAAGDGHHNNTDVLSAWFSEAGGRLQAVVRVRQAVWEPAHDDSDAAGFAVLFTTGGVRRYVRVEAPRGAALRYDHGTWTEAGGFVSAGATTGEVTTGTGGTATIDVPGAASGTVLAQPFVLTYDGATAGVPHWVDRAPGGVSPSEASFGADYVVGACAAGGSAGAGGPGAATSAVVLDTPRRVVGAGKAKLRGRVVPGAAGVAVKLTLTARGRTVVRRVTTGAGGAFAVSVPVSERTTVSAAAAGLRSQTQSIAVRSTVRLRLRGLAGGSVRVTGKVSPKLPGRILLLGADAVDPVATTKARKGRFALRLSRLRSGRYQVVFIPSGARAERSTSNAGAIR
jgi:hypothetical protein